MSFFLLSNKVKEMIVCIKKIFFVASSKNIKLIKSIFYIKVYSSVRFVRHQGLVSAENG